MGNSTAPPLEDEVMTAWLAKAAPMRSAAVDMWRLNPARPRRLLCGIVFDIVVCRHVLVEGAYRLLDQYEQPLGPALVLPALGLAAVLVPKGTDTKWSALVEATQWPDGISRPTCLGEGHAIQVPAPKSGGTSATRWLQPPEVTAGFPPHLTNPVPLARCLDEARSELRPTRMKRRRRTVTAARLGLVGRWSKS